MSIDVLNLISNIVLGVIGIFLSFAVYNQTQQRVKETWLQTYAELHKSFWDDNEIQEVRCWLSYPRAYAKLKTVLMKRKLLFDHSQNTPELKEAEYIMLDKLDKYLNYLMRAITVNPRLPKRQDLWGALHFKYWLNVCLDSGRPELIWYIEKYYKPVYDFGHSLEVRQAGEQLGFNRQKPN